jgi:hypothetical protein
MTGDIVPIYVSVPKVREAVDHILQAAPLLSGPKVIS